MTAPLPAGDTIAALLASATARLNSSGSDSPLADAEILLAHALDKPRSHLRAWPDRTPPEADRSAFARLVDKREAGHPVAYLVGSREFWSLRLRVTPATLIPRPDTETLVEAALARLATGDRGAVADLGTGSGAIALAIASERPDLRVVATDASAEALAVAQDNAHTLKIGNVRFVRGDWCDALQGERYQLIASNPPYIREGDRHLDVGDLRFEPHAALIADGDGLADIRAIAAGATHALIPGGYLLLEHGFEQAAAVVRILRDNGYIDIESLPDLNGHLRVTLATLSQARLAVTDFAR